jgi:hypothetical protein
MPIDFVEIREKPMGGIGSGNRWRSKSATCADFQRIDLATMRRRNWLTPGGPRQLYWTRGGERVGSIGYTVNPHSMTLDYRTRDDGGEWKPVRYEVWLQRTRPHFGGERLWFLCPRCHRRCRILYGGAYFYCRKCYRLGYESQSEESWQRQITRAEKIRARLGEDQCVEWPFPPKPKGMHWKTYRRLEAIDGQAQDAWESMAAGFLARF